MRQALQGLFCQDLCHFQFFVVLLSPHLLKIYYKSFIYYRSLLGNLELTVIFFMKTASAEFPLVSYLSNIYKRFDFKINLIEIRGY